MNRSCLNSPGETEETLESLCQGSRSPARDLRPRLPYLATALAFLYSYGYTTWCRAPQVAQISSMFAVAWTHKSNASWCTLTAWMIHSAMRYSNLASKYIQNCFHSTLHFTILSEWKYIIIQFILNCLDMINVEFHYSKPNARLAR
jgi:hypothetical protein